MLDVIVNTVGGYWSDGFITLAFGTMIVGYILDRINALFGVLFMFGSVLLFSWINYVVTTTPGLPDWAQYIPLLFAVAITLSTFNMVARSGSSAKDKSERKSK